MTCKCGTPAEFGSVDRIDGYDAGTQPWVVIENGGTCMDCDSFTCTACAKQESALDPDFDWSLCIACNRQYVAAQA